MGYIGLTPPSNTRLAHCLSKSLFFFFKKKKKMATTDSIQSTPQSSSTLT